MKENRKIKTPNSKLPSITPSGKKDHNFSQLVFEIVRQIPKGRVTSYGAIAQSLGMEKSARMVGWALSNCSNAAPKVPAHRVVNSSGVLSGRHAFKTPTLMQELLEKEGIVVKNNKVIHFKKYFWDPMEEL
ncbi:Methylated-DNA--protein-cysteine methyltransferase [Mycovorax composti]|jgi:O-6-methylguanine DNA methyltransferase|uniref:Methylated-DNA--protein-cysteine methyltransferase n=2 Tax=Chitinophagaceae TaxID=563835 RepID=A0ABZ2EH87_9BACT